MPRLLGRPEDRQPAVGDLEGLAHRLRGHRCEVDRDVRAQRPRHQLEGLAEARAVAARDVVVLAVELQRLRRSACERSRRTRVFGREASPTAGRASPRRPAAPTSRARGGSARRRAGRGRRRHRGVRRRASRDLHDRRAQLQRRRRRPEPREHAHRVGPHASAAQAESYPSRSASWASAIGSSGLVPGGRSPCRARASCSIAWSHVHRPAMLTPMAIADLRPTDEVLQLRARVRAFMEEHVYPAEPVLAREDDDADALVERLRGVVKEQAVGTPPAAGGGRLERQLPRLRTPERGDRTLGLGAAHLRLPGPRRRQRRDPLALRHGRAEGALAAPLAAGEVRSFFSMTEPEVSGSDPTGLRTRAARDGDEWVIDGHKWFSSGAEGAAFGIVMAVTDPEAEPHRRATQIIVPADARGVEIAWCATMGHRGRGWTTHCEIRYSGVRVPVENALGGVGEGFRLAQKRFGPGRIHHVMRWLGQMQRVRADARTRSNARPSAGCSRTSRRCRTGSPTRRPRSRRAAAHARCRTSARRGRRGTSRSR